MEQDKPQPHIANPAMTASAGVARGILPDEDPIIVEEDAKNRCQHSKTVNQCRYEQVDGQAFCKYHIFLYIKDYKHLNKQRKYRIFQGAARVEEFCSNPELKNLDAELGMLMYLLETIWNQCHTPFDKMVNSSKIESLVERIQRCMITGQKLKIITGQALDKNTLAILIDKITAAIVEENLPGEALARVGAKVAKAMEEAKIMSAENALREDK